MGVKRKDKPSTKFMDIGGIAIRVSLERGDIV